MPPLLTVKLEMVLLFSLPLTVCCGKEANGNGELMANVCRVSSSVSIMELLLLQTVMVVVAVGIILALLMETEISEPESLNSEEQ